MSTGLAVPAPLQHLKVVDSSTTPICLNLIGDFMKFERLHDGSEDIHANSTLSNSMFGTTHSLHNRGLATHLSIWSKRGPANILWSRWDVPPITSITVILGDAVSARQAGYTIIPIDLSPSFHTSMLMGSLLLGYR